MLTIVLVVAITLAAYLFFLFFGNKSENLQGRILRSPGTISNTEYTQDPNLNGAFLSGGTETCSDGTVVANVSQCGGHGCPESAPCYESATNTCSRACLETTANSNKSTASCWAEVMVCERACSGTDEQVFACRVACEARTCIQ